MENLTNDPLYHEERDLENKGIEKGTPLTGLAVSPRG